jgi:hypothetical protein
MLRQRENESASHYRKPSPDRIARLTTTFLNQVRRNGSFAKDHVTVHLERLRVPPLEKSAKSLASVRSSSRDRTACNGRGRDEVRVLWIASR